ncbi:13788_t:CDS:10 [Entrophospora sp. SA101]|nr:13788_t:CDS:10 [Entrophospora sp. SA101]
MIVVNNNFVNTYESTELHLRICAQSLPNILKEEIGINGTDDIAVAVFNNKVFIGGSILPSAPSDPYFDDVIDKYFCRPKNHIFESMTYPDYFRDYNIKNKPPGPRSKLYSTRDLKGSELATWGVFKFQGEVPEHVSNEIPASFDQTGSQFTDKAIISVLADLDKNDLWDIIYQQFMTLEKPSSSKLTSILMFDNEQYRVYDILCRTIHSALKLRQFDGHHQTLSLESEELLEIKAIIVEEISVVSGAKNPNDEDHIEGGFKTSEVVVIVDIEGLVAFNILSEIINDDDEDDLKLGSESNKPRPFGSGVFGVVASDKS